MSFHVFPVSPGLALSTVGRIKFSNRAKDLRNKNRFQKDVFSHRTCSAVVTTTERAARLVCNGGQLIQPFVTYYLSFTNTSTFSCGNNCLPCNCINDGLTSVYTFNSNGETRFMNRRIDCDSKNVIFMIHCNHCQRPLNAEHCRPVDKH